MILLGLVNELLNGDFDFLLSSLGLCSIVAAQQINDAA
jgi:hypothetical protein